MKSLFIVCLFAFLSHAVHADPLLNQAYDIENPDDDVHAEYIVNHSNPELGRAWLRMTYSDGRLRQEFGYAQRSIDIPLDGLHYDSARAAIVYTAADGTEAICADQVRRSFWTAKRYHETGDCLLKVSNVVMPIDNGFYVKAEHRAHLTFEIAKK